MAMLDAVYVDTVEEKAVVAITPKPGFMPLFEAATTRESSGVVLVRERELPPGDLDPEAAMSPCFWQRRRRVEDAIPNFVWPEHGCEEGDVGWIGLNADEVLPIDGDSVEHLPDQGLPLRVGHPWVQPKGREVLQQLGSSLQVG